jgi:hypothetical protein
VNPSREQRIVRLAGRQNGNVTGVQLRELGLGRYAIAHRARTERLFPVHQGVFAVGRPPQTVVEIYAAAVLACGPGAALSHFSALWLWELSGTARPPEIPHVTTPSHRTRPGIRTHEARHLAPTDLRTHRDIRTTSPARTMLDCARQLDRAHKLTRTLAEGRRRRILSEPAMLDVCARFPNHPGAAPLTRAIVHHVPTRSEFEDRFAPFCADYGLPIPIFNAPVAGYEADAYFPDHKLVIELDSWEFHKDRDAFISDRDRDTDRLAAGIATVRITWERLTHTPAKEAARLHTIIAARADA